MNTPSNPWQQPAPTDPVAGPADVQKKLAIAGYKHGVAQGLVDPKDGLDRLKKFGAVDDSTEVQHLLPNYAAQDDQEGESNPDNGEDTTDTSDPQNQMAGGALDRIQAYQKMAMATAPMQNPWTPPAAPAAKAPAGKQYRFNGDWSRNPDGSLKLNQKGWYE